MARILTRQRIRSIDRLEFLKKPVMKKDKPKSPLVSTRRIRREVERNLYTLAGGRCEFDGCNRFLLKHELTHIPGNFAEMAHIYAFSTEGPRGESEGRPSDINDIQNLILLCPECHKLVDDHSDRFNVSTLRRHKVDHEKRIHYLTSFDKDRKTTIIQVLSKVGGQASALAMADVMDAVAPRYPEDPQGIVVDLNQLDDSLPTFIETACHTVSQRLLGLYDQCINGKRCGHLSVFAIAPIPVLIHLGTQISNKIPTDFYQRHRDTENWTWKSNGVQVRYSFECIRTGTEAKNVALVLSLSGRILIDQLPRQIDSTYFIYELSLDGIPPTPTFLNQYSDVEEFRLQYQNALRKLSANHSGLSEICLFPAVPAPIAVLCGRELLPKRDPSIAVYDYVKSKGGFTFALTINN